MPALPDRATELQTLKAEIARVFSQREALKREMETGITTPRQGFSRLEALDLELSGLDARYKTLWDAANPRPTPSPHNEDILP
jgi:hypothetical protein